MVYGDLGKWRRPKKQSQWPAIGRKYVTRWVGKNSSVWRFFAGEGNIDADPLFANPENGGYHLKSQSGRWQVLQSLPHRSR